MPVKNSYPHLPEIAFERTAVDMKAVMAYACSKVGEYPKEVVRMAYCIFYNESAAGYKGVNNNYAGIQADCGRWTGLSGEIATCVKKDSGGAIRRFICFDLDGYKHTLDLLLFACKRRGMFIGAIGVTDWNTLGTAYLNKWVGRKALQAERSFKALYETATRAII